MRPTTRAPFSVGKMWVLLVVLVALTVGVTAALGVLLWGIIGLAVVFGTVWFWWPRQRPEASG